jgi:WD40 repeat protein
VVLTVVQVWSGDLGQPLEDSGDLAHGWVMALAFSPSGMLIANAFRDGHLRVSRPDLSTITTMQAHGSSANTVAWSGCCWM